MYLTKTEYDRGVNTFSPEGRLFQVEYAIEAVKLGSTAVGIQTREGVVLAVEKRLTSPLLEPSSVEKILEIDTHKGAAMSGLIGGNWKKTLNIVFYICFAFFINCHLMHFYLLFVFFLTSFPCQMPEH